MTAPYQKACFAAIVLNNVGVSLIESRRFGQAIDVFNDALTLVRDTSKCYLDNNSGKSLHPRAFAFMDTIESKLQKANNSLTQSLRDNHDEKRSCENKFRVVSNQDVATVVGASLEAAGMIASVSLFLIRIERIALPEEEDLDMDFLSSIILYNFGMVYESMATTAIKRSTPSQANQHSLRAYKLIALALSLLQNQCSLADDQDCEEYSGQYLPIVMVVLRSLVGLKSMEEMEEERQEYSTQMAAIQETFLEMEYFLVGSTCIAAAAA